MKNLFLASILLSFALAGCMPPQHGPNDNAYTDEIEGLKTNRSYDDPLIGRHNSSRAGYAFKNDMPSLLISRQLTELTNPSDKRYVENTSQGALEKNELGVTSRWTNQETGNSGTITPTKSFQLKTGDFCREFTQTVVIGGERQEAYSTACRKSNGYWSIIN